MLELLIQIIVVFRCLSQGELDISRCLGVCPKGRLDILRCLGVCSKSGLEISRCLGLGRTLCPDYRGVLVSVPRVDLRY